MSRNGVGKDKRRLTADMHPLASRPLGMDYVIDILERMARLELVS